MKKVLITLAIIAVVVGIHFLVVKLITSKSSGPDQSTDQSTEAQPPKEEGDKNIGTNPEPVATPEVIEPDKTERPAPLSYKSAINGDVREIPTSKNATTGILVDLDTRQVLWAKNPRKPVPIASMTKMMTELIAFEKLSNNKQISLETPVQVTPSSMKIGGSQIHLDVRETFTLGELLKTVMIVSANDSAELVAEFMSGGNRPAFVADMNRRSRELLLPGAKFYNPTGLPGKTAAEDNVCSPEGCIFLAEMLLRYPQAVEWASTRLDYLPRKTKNEKTMLANHNKLVGACPGVNGMKTGFIQRSGYCITVTCIRGGKRLACVVTGFNTSKERNDFVRKLLDWGYTRAANMPASSDPLDEILK